MAVYDSTKPFLGTVTVVASTPPGTPARYVGSMAVVASGSVPAGLAQPYLGQVVSGSPPAGAQNPSLGQVVIVGSAPAGVPNPFLGTTQET